MLRPRLKLLILLVPLAVLWWWLSCFAPIFGWNGFSSFSDGKRFGLSHNDPYSSFVFDIERRQYRFARTPAEAYSPGPSGVSFVPSANQIDQEISHGRLDVYNHAEQRIVRSIELILPIESQVKVVASRFVVAEMPDEIRWLDLKAPVESWQTIPTNRVDYSWIWAHPTLPIFRRSFCQVTPLASQVTPANKKPPKCFTELYRFDEQGNLQLLSSWQTADSGKETLYNAWFQDSTITSLNPTATAIEVRSLDDGALSKQIELSEPVDLSTHEFRFDYGTLSIDDPKRRVYSYYSLAHERRLTPPSVLGADVEGPWTSAGLQLSGDGQTALWVRRAKPAAVITDPATDAQICQIQDPGDRYSFLNPNTLVSIDPWLGLTIRQHDLKTGETLWVWRPVGWVLPVLALAIFGSIAWVCMWLRLPRQSMIWAWADVHALHLILVILIVVRLRAIGEAGDIARMPYQHAIYLTSGFLFVVWAWLIHGRGSIVNRLSHCAITYAIVLAGLAQVFTEDGHRAWTGVALVSIPSLLALPLFITARLRQWSSLAIHREPSQQSSGTSQEIITLKQLLIITAAFACLSVAARPIALGIFGIFQLQWPIPQAVGITASGIVAMFIANCNQTRWRRLGFGLVVGIVVLFVVEALWLATYGWWWKPMWWFSWESQIRHCLGQFCTVFVVVSALKSSITSDKVATRPRELAGPVMVAD